ncbi:hypothetical protein IG631_12715 [Alternaria alternata]|nr:hypothetical protein IG631_12715 [Alternaria alternata]
MQYDPSTDTCILCLRPVPILPTLLRLARPRNFTVRDERSVAPGGSLEHGLPLRLRMCRLGDCCRLPGVDAVTPLAGMVRLLGCSGWSWFLGIGPQYVTY